MRSAVLCARLRQILRASVSAPLALAACGGASSLSSGGPGGDASGVIDGLGSTTGDSAGGDSTQNPTDDGSNPDVVHALDGAASDGAALDASASDHTTGDSAGGDDATNPFDGGSNADVLATLDSPSSDGSYNLDGCSTPDAGIPAGCTDGGFCTGCVSYSLPLTGDPAACGLTASYSCLPGGGTPNPAALCASLCHQGAGCSLAQLADGGNEVSCRYGICCTGRRPGGLTVAAAYGTPLARWFAETAVLEAASVDAFAILRDELAAHGAPRGLQRAAERARRDEVRHALVTCALARRHGASPHRPRTRRGPVRSLEAMATENAVEGCVRETFGVLVGMWQARFARDAHVREAMKRIAVDEMRHAALGWQVAKWAESRLDESARARVRSAQTAAVAELAAQVGSDPAPEVMREAGVPSARAARTLLSEARRTLWA